MEKLLKHTLFVDQYIVDMKTVLDQLPVDRIQQLIELLHEARMAGNHVFIMGNGGSASTASHFVCDLGKNTRRDCMPGFHVVGLTDNMAMFSALANDEGYENVFAQQLESLVHPNDVVIAISASGNSENVLRAVELANAYGARTVGLTGMGGGKLSSMVNLEICVPSYQIQQVEDVHLMLDHIICSALTRIEVQGLDNEAFADYQKAAAEMYAGQTSEKIETGTNGNGRTASDKPDLNVLLREVIARTGAQSATLILLDHEDEKFAQAPDGFALRNGEEIHMAPEQLAEILQNGLAGWVIRNRKAALVNSTHNDSRWLRRPWENGGSVGQSALSIPLVDGKKVIGSITVLHHQPYSFTMQDLHFLTELSGKMSELI
jgi:D-sedoheptulose 7-phosphate isomerase